MTNAQTIDSIAKLNAAADSMLATAASLRERTAELRKVADANRAEISEALAKGIGEMTGIGESALAKFEAYGDDLLKRTMAHVEERLRKIAADQDEAAVPLWRQKKG